VSQGGGPPRSRSSTAEARFFFVQDPDGYKIEVLQRHGRYR
jgi:lactoylglutathione lyase